MVDVPRIPVARPGSPDSLAAAVVRGARSSRPRVLLLWLAGGMVLLVTGIVLHRYRIPLVAGGLAAMGFGAGGLADRALAIEQTDEVPDRPLVVGFTIVRLVATALGTTAAVAGALWLLYVALGSSMWH